MSDPQLREAHARVSEAQRDQIIRCTDPDQLERWIRRAFTVTSASELLGTTDSEDESTRDRFPSEPAGEELTERELAAWNVWHAKQLARREGFAMGLGKAVLHRLSRRGVPVSDAQFGRILRCTDVNQQELWLDRALSVASADELFT